MQHLDCQSLAGRRYIQPIFINGLKYRAHCTLAQHGFDPVAAPQHTARFEFEDGILQLNFLAMRMGIRGFCTQSSLWNDDIARYVFGLGAQSARRLKDDTAVTSTIRLLSGVTSPRALLERASSSKP